MKQAFEVKSARVDILSILLKSIDHNIIESQLLQWLDKFSDLRTMPFMLDVHELDDPWNLRLDILLKFIHEHGLNIVGIQHTEKSFQAIATKYKLAFTLMESEQYKHAEPLPIMKQQYQPPIVVDKPIRSGQQVYAENTDLIITAIVNEGAEIIADGHIHIYAPMRGRALAGASGNQEARIFIQSMQAQLVSIAGIYRTFDQKLPISLNKKPVLVQLNENKLAITALN